MKIIFSFLNLWYNIDVKVKKKLINFLIGPKYRGGNSTSMGE